VGDSRSVMVGEFRDDNGADYAMVVNLDLTASLCLLLDTQREHKRRAVLSPDSGAWLPLDEQSSLAIDPSFKGSHAPGGEAYRNGLWLTAGQGLLLRFGE